MSTRTDFLATVYPAATNPAGLDAVTFLHPGKAVPMDGTMGTIPSFANTNYTVGGTASITGGMLILIAIGIAAFYVSTHERQF